MNGLIAVTSLSTIVSAALPASAQSDITRAPVAPASRSLGRQGQVTLSAERLFGFSRIVGYDSYTVVSLFGASGYELVTAPYSVPRLAIDLFVTDGFSVGSGASFARVARPFRSNLTLIALYPRLGYAITASESFTFWPRAGLSYLHLKEEDNEAGYILAATIEPAAAITGKHFGFEFTPAADIGLAASGSGNLTQFGVTTALIAWF